MWHKIILVGNLGRDPEMRYTPSGQPVTNFSMATSSKWTGADGQVQEQTIWWRVTVWAKQAENCNQFLKKGSKVLVEGVMKPDPKTGNPRIWTRQDGTPSAAYEVTGHSVKFLSSRSENGNGNGNGHSETSDEEAPSDFDGEGGDTL